MPVVSRRNFNKHGVACRRLVVHCTVRVVSTRFDPSARMGTFAVSSRWPHQIHVDFCCERSAHRYLWGIIHTKSATRSVSKQHAQHALYSCNRTVCYRPDTTPRRRAVVCPASQHLNRHVVSNPCDVPLLQSVGSRVCSPWCLRSTRQCSGRR